MPSPRPTLSDLARETGVSSATVDRVINNRRGVHPRTRDLVMTAARRIGYLPEGRPVAEVPRAPLRFAFLLPAGNNAFIDALRRQIEAQARERPDLDARVEMIEGFNPDSLARRLDEVPGSLDGLGLVALDHPLVREALRRLARRGVGVVTLASDVLNVPRVAYVGIDNRQAGRLAGYILGRFLPKGETAKVAFFAGSRSYRGHEEREMGFRSVLAEDFPGAVIVAQCESMDDPERAYAETRAVLEAHPDLAAIYNAGAGNPGIAWALRERDLARRVVLIGHEATEGNKRLLLDGVLDAVIDQNPRVEVREALNVLTGAARQEPYGLVQPRLQVVFRENLPED
ncbi:regulatory protein, LacI [Rubellimicrobium mesophilum DSM 19309]|uniref:Regulatory protein, LacI n=1 Tax=Rubellimicrobium mesophilum DSM 19309 TaxID=442562 RepID=A0A017HQE3_9RHOB|nr:LacI family DNA-binding transcriptional regulator [Rubellimicrobium mesophilum]EYD76398.1 regulatory protein, LacI [Rubellimicrobium mesophilum DSM 19309]